MEDEILLFVLTSSLETSINSVFKIHLLFLPKNWEGSAVEINLGFMQFSCIVPSHNNSLGKSTSQKQKKSLHFSGKLAEKCNNYTSELWDSWSTNENPGFISPSLQYQNHYLLLFSPSFSLTWECLWDKSLEK